MTYQTIHPTTRYSKVEGFLCIKKEFFVVCEENLLGFRKFEYGHKIVESTSKECYDAIHSYQEDLLDTDTFVEKTCGWNSVNKESKYVFQIVRKSVLLDPYDLHFTSDVFPGGTCRYEVCDTLHQGMKWITLHPAKQSCPSLIHHDLRVYLGDQKN